MNTTSPASTDIATAGPLLINPCPSGPLGIGSPLTVPEGSGGLIICDGKPLDLLRPGQYTLDSGSAPLLAQRLASRQGEATSVYAVLLPTPGMVTMPWSAPLRGHTTKRGNFEYVIGGHVRVKITDPFTFYGSFAEAWATRSLQMNEAEAASAQALSPGKIAELWIGHTVGREASCALAPLLLPVEQLVHPGKEENAAIAQAAAQWLAGVGLECTGITLDPAQVSQYGGCDRCGRMDRPSNYGTFRRYLAFFWIKFEKMEQGAFCTPCAAGISANFNVPMIFCGLRSVVYIISNCVAFTHVAWINHKMRAGAPQ